MSPPTPTSSSSPPPSSSSSPPPSSSSSSPLPSSSPKKEASKEVQPPSPTPSTTLTPPRPPSSSSQAIREDEEDEDGLYDWNVSPEYLKHLQEKYKDENFPLFMDDDLPKNIEENPHLLALQQLAYDGETPKTVAERCKADGNAWLQGKHEEQIEEEEKEKNRKKNDQGQREGEEKEEEKKIKRRRGYSAHMALQSYTRGLEQRCEDEVLNSLLLSNRAQCHLILGDLVACINDCRQAIRKHPQNIRAYYRASRASFLLELYRQSAAFATKGLELDPANPDFLKLKDEAEACLHARHERRKKLEEEEKKAEETNRRKGAKQTLSPLSILSKREDEDQEKKKANVILKKEDVFSSVLFFTVMLLFDEYMVTETITDFDERRTLRFYLIHMFPASSSSEKKRETENPEGDKTSQKEEEEEGVCVKYVEWDKDRKYTVDALAAYYECSMPGDMLYKISLDVSLQDILFTVKRIAGLPIFHMLVEGSPAEKTFLKDAMVEILHPPDVVIDPPSF
ncbi:tetratricopeptide repeat-containing protein [Cystoisospora suis]|uniref:Tetratricopeptide repeat-containing protein n=1 Tax=Cystoisospora suis TaxID=483139 RepID=A0A2C6LDB2_9APIC|nr:tetratricopeptide repeat-containing protein [Cystoisospora suis]